MAAAATLNDIAKALVDDGASSIRLEWGPSHEGIQVQTWRAVVKHPDMFGEVWSLSTDPYEALRAARVQMRTAVMGTR